VQVRAELYPIAADPDESKNLIDDPRHAAKIKELQTELARLMFVSVQLRVSARFD
jgi:hypothetical protein